MASKVKKLRKLLFHNISERFPEWKNLVDAADVEGHKLTDERSWLTYAMDLYERGVLVVGEFIEEGRTIGTAYEFRLNLLTPKLQRH